MRTTLNLDDDVMQRLKEYASGRSIPLGTAASELVRRGLETPVQLRMVNGFCVVDIPADTATVTSERVKELLEEDI